MPVDLRLQIHFRPSNPCLHLARAINKYGGDAFVCYEIARELTQEDADALETALIREHDSTRTGFNILPGPVTCRRPRTVCLHGHDLTLPDARNKQSNCRVCVNRYHREKARRTRNDPERWAKQLAYLREWKRARRADTEYRAAELARDLEREHARNPLKNKPKPVTCSQGHDLTAGGSKTKRGGCRACDNQRSRDAYLRRCATPELRAQLNAYQLEHTRAYRQRKRKEQKQEAA